MDEKILVEKNVEEVEKKTQTLELTDNRNWDFRAAQYCDFTALDKTMDCTSATEFFNQTNGLGSPAFYEDRKRKELEEKENKGRRITRSQTKKNENEVAQKPVDLVTRMEKMEKLKKQITRRSNQIVVIPDRSDLPSQSTLEKAAAARLNRNVPAAKPRSIPAISRGRSPAPAAKPQPAASRGRSPAPTVAVTTRGRSPASNVKPPVAPVVSRGRSPAPTTKPQPTSVVTRGRNPAPTATATTRGRSPAASQLLPKDRKTPAPVVVSRTRAPTSAVKQQPAPVASPCVSPPPRRRSFMDPTESSRRRSVIPLPVAVRKAK